MEASGTSLRLVTHSGVRGLSRTPPWASGGRATLPSSRSGRHAGRLGRFVGRQTAPDQTPETTAHLAVCWNVHATHPHFGARSQLDAPPSLANDHRGAFCSTPAACRSSWSRSAQEGLLELTSTRGGPGHNDKRVFSCGIEGFDEAASFVAASLRIRRAILTIALIRRPVVIGDRKIRTGSVYLPNVTAYDGNGVVTGGINHPQRIVSVPSNVVEVTRKLACSHQDSLIDEPVAGHNRLHQGRPINSRWLIAPSDRIIHQ